MLGQIIMEKLADCLAEAAYGSDKDKVQANIESKIVDCNNFDSSLCTLSSSLKER
jgi:hypothetical protein